MKLNSQRFTAGLTPEQIKGAIVIGWRGWIALLSTYVFIGWQVVGISRPVRADEVEKKIAAAVEPIKKEMSEQRAILNELSQQVKESLAEAKASEIRHWISRRCKETNPTERDRINNEIRRKQEEYKRLRGNGEEYRVTCEEV